MGKSLKTDGLLYIVILIQNKDAIR